MGVADEWVAYNQVQRLGNVANLNHDRVNYSLHFVDQVTGGHT